MSKNLSERFPENELLENLNILNLERIQKKMWDITCTETELKKLGEKALVILHQFFKNKIKCNKEFQKGSMESNKDKDNLFRHQIMWMCIENEENVLITEWIQFKNYFKNNCLKIEERQILMLMNTELH